MMCVFLIFPLVRVEGDIQSGDYLSVNVKLFICKSKRNYHFILKIIATKNSSATELK